MADEKKVKQEQLIVPDGVPACPPYADAFVVRNVNGLITVYLMRIPAAFNEEQRHNLFDGPELHAPVVSTVTLSLDLALKLADSIGDFGGRPRPG